MSLRARCAPALLALIFAAGCSGERPAPGPSASSPSVSSSPTPRESEPPASPAEPTAATETVKAGESSYSVAFDYPVLTYPGRDQVTAAVNKTVKDVVDRSVASFETEARQSFRPELGPSSLEAEFDVVRLDRDWVSYTFSLSEYYSGAAHPGGSHLTFTFDLEDGSELALSDLFKPGADYLSAVSGICRPRVTEKIDERADGLDESLLASIREGTAPTQENYTAWAVSPDELLIIFEAYQLGPYALGSHECEVAADDLASRLAPEGPLKA